VGESAGKRSVGRPRSRLEDNIKFYPQERGLEDIDWIYVPSIVKKIAGICEQRNETQIPQNARNFSIS